MNKLMKILCWMLGINLTLNLASAATTAMTELADNQSLLSIQTMWASIMPSGFGMIPLLLALVAFFVLLWSKQPIEAPAILMMIFLASFSFLMTEGGFELGSWAFWFIAVGALTVLFLKIFWRD